MSDMGGPSCPAVLREKHRPWLALAFKGWRIGAAAVPPHVTAWAASPCSRRNSSPRGARTSRRQQLPCRPRPAPRTGLRLHYANWPTLQWVTLTGLRGEGRDSGFVGPLRPAPSGDARASPRLKASARQLLDIWRGPGVALRWLPGVEERKTASTRVPRAATPYLWAT